MTRDDFCKFHWEYYLVLENDFLTTERYIAFDNNNFKCFSNEYIKQYQSICSEIDVILKSICKEINTASNAGKITEYTPVVLSQWSNIVNQTVDARGLSLQPFKDWTVSPGFNSPFWWTPYNNVKHNRLCYYQSANLENVINSLAGLYILELYLVKYIGDRDNDMDVPNDISKVFSINNFSTKDTVYGKNTYGIRPEEIDAMFQRNIEK